MSSDDFESGSMHFNDLDRDPAEGKLYVYCHECRRRLHVAMTNTEAANIAESHACDPVSWKDEPVEGDSNV